jgi:hypothetical protein
VSNGPGRVGGADQVYYPARTPCTPGTFGQLHSPGSVAPAQLSHPGSVTVTLAQLVPSDVGTLPDTHLTALATTARTTLRPAG